MTARIACALSLATALLVTQLAERDNALAQTNSKTAQTSQHEHQSQVTSPAAPPAFVQQGVMWLVKAQHESGGWGGGSHANQQIRDPHAVQTDPATTAFSALALLRAGHTPLQGEYRQAVRRALEYLLSVVEQAPEQGARITNLQGTQPQAKLGRLVDTSMTAQFLARVSTEVKEDKQLAARVNQALAKCVRKLQTSQHTDGSWNSGGGWAPVLQSSLSCTALELAQAIGQRVDMNVLERARDYQKKNVNLNNGRVAAGAAAGVELYAFAGAQRANAIDFREAKDEIRQAELEGKLAAGAEITRENLLKAGLSSDRANKLAASARQNEAQVARLDDERLLAGFGNNGGEEFLSYLMTSESLVIAGGENWTTWNAKMQNRLAKIQNPDGSWNGHHCISSPVFCTAAVIQCLTTDRDAERLVRLAALKRRPK